MILSHSRTKQELEPPKVKVEVVMEFINGYSWIDMYLYVFVWPIDSDMI